MAAMLPPPLNAPPSAVTVKVSAIDTTLRLTGVSTKDLWDPYIKGFGRKERAHCGSWVFLIEHPSGRKLLYDLGMRKDWESLAPALGLKQLLSELLEELTVEKNVSDILEEGGMKLDQIEGIIWSHWHWDHTGDPSTFPPSTKLIVGEGFKNAFLPGYPTDPRGRVLESDFQDREIMEIDFSKTETHIGRFKAVDYFGDGSFYILDSPGHAIGHVNAMARTHASPSAGFIHMAGDSAHHVAEIRPTEYLPLPERIHPSPVPSIYASSCPGHLFAPVLRNGSRTEHILEFKDPFPSDAEDKKYGTTYDESALRETIRKDEEADADDGVFTMIAHDWTVKGVIDEWPKSLNTWKDKGWKESSRWKFLEEFIQHCQ